MRTDITSTWDGDQATTWQTLVLLTLAVWLGASLLLDLVIMPSLYAAGMTSQPGFAIAGHFIFSIFNRIELVIAAMVATGFLILAKSGSGLPGLKRYLILPLTFLLLAVPLIYTYVLTPEMSAIGMQLNLIESARSPVCQISPWHQLYWGLEVLKLGLCGALLTQLFPPAAPPADGSV